MFTSITKEPKKVEVGNPIIAKKFIDFLMNCRLLIIVIITIITFHFNLTTASRHFRRRQSLGRRRRCRLTIPWRKQSLLLFHRPRTLQTTTLCHRNLSTLYPICQTWLPMRCFRAPRRRRRRRRKIRSGAGGGGRRGNGAISS